jgi:hypothetical protein
MPKPEFEGYRQESRKQYDGDESSSSLLDENLHQLTDNASKFMTRIRETDLTEIDSNDERRQVLNPRVTWHGSIDRF